MTRRSLALALLGWTAVVVLVSFAIWVVIDGAGGELGEDATEVTSGLTTASVPTQQPRPTRTASRTPSATPSSSPPTSAPEAPTSADPPTAAPPPAQVRTWQGRAGSVTVACTGATLSLKGAAPSDGYRVDKRESSGGREIEVRFEQVSGGEDEVEVHASCRAGTPVFEVDDKSSDD
ncbi:MAG TPA: hypothetical protein VFK52_05120 [Nocardioidaceae bacterium]|nr:hypothetical protein [Nocardioidaceae bacterium]